MPPSSSKPPGAPAPAPAASGGGFFSKEFDRQRSVARRRRQIDKKRRYLTGPVFMLVVGGAMVFLLQLAYRPLKAKYWRPDPRGGKVGTLDVGFNPFDYFRAYMPDYLQGLEEEGGTGDLEDAFADVPSAPLDNAYDDEFSPPLAPPAPSPLDGARALLSNATLLASLGARSPALSLYDACLSETEEAANSPEPPALADTRLLAAGCSRAAGELLSAMAKPKAAEPYLLRAAGLHLQLNTTEHNATAEEIGAGVADAFLARGKLGEAEMMYARSGDAVGLGLVSADLRQYKLASGNFSAVVDSEEREVMSARLHGALSGSCRELKPRIRDGKRKGSLDRYSLPAQSATLSKQKGSAWWYLKANGGSGQASTHLIKGSKAAAAFPTSNSSLPPLNYTASKFLPSPLLFGEKKADLRVPVLVRGSWPLARVYVHGNSTAVRLAEEAFEGWEEGYEKRALTSAGRETTFWEFKEKLLGRSAIDEDVESMEVEVTIEGVEQGADGFDGGMLGKVRKNNFDNLWLSLVRDLGKIFGEGAMRVPEMGANWRETAANAHKKDVRAFFAADVALAAGGDPEMGLLSAARSHVVEIKRSLDGAGAGGRQRTWDTIMMLAGGWDDRAELDRIRKKEVEVEAMDNLLLAQRLSWCVQKVTEKICGEGEEKAESCDHDKIGMYAMELVVATFEYQRKGGWELAFPLAEEGGEGEGGEGEGEGAVEARVLRSLFVKWVKQHEKEQDRKRGRRNEPPVN